MTTSVHRTHPSMQPSIGRVFLSAVLALVLLCALVSAFVGGTLLLLARSVNLASF